MIEFSHRMWLLMPPLPLDINFKGSKVFWTSTLNIDNICIHVVDSHCIKSENRSLHKLVLTNQQPTLDGQSDFFKPILKLCLQGEKYADIDFLPKYDELTLRPSNYWQIIHFYEDYKYQEHIHLLVYEEIPLNSYCRGERQMIFNVHVPWWKLEEEYCHLFYFVIFV